MAIARGAWRKLAPLVALATGALLFSSPDVRAQQTPPVTGQAGQRAGGAAPPAGQRGGGGRGRGAVQVMTFYTVWPDGGAIPRAYSQAGRDTSPPLSWTNVPETAQSFVLIVHDADAATGQGTDDLLQWMLWNIPGASRSLPERVPQGPQLPDGTRQISATGPYYRGPGAPASGPAHHYVLELFALDAMLEVPAVGASPAETRAAVVAAMAGHVRGKAVLVGLYKREVMQ